VLKTFSLFTEDSTYKQTKFAGTVSFKGFNSKLCKCVKFSGIPRKVGLLATTKHLSHKKSGSEKKLYLKFIAKSL
jgi:hypothetical protein